MPHKEHVIDLSDMTKDAIDVAVLKMAATSPLTIFPILGSLLLVAFWVIFEATLAVGIIGVGIAILGIVNIVLSTTARKQSLTNVYFKKLRAASEEKARQELAEIIEFLAERNFEQGSLQVSKLDGSMKSFEKVLNRKFEPHEFAHARYHRVAEQVFLGALENLREIVTTIEAIDSIDPDYIQGRMGELERVCNDNDGLTDTQYEEVETLKERWQIREDGFAKIDGLLLLNEKAMTELEKIASNIASTKTTGEDVEAELAKNIKKLNDLGREAQETWG